MGALMRRYVNYAKFDDGGPMGGSADSAAVASYNANPSSLRKPGSSLASLYGIVGDTADALNPPGTYGEQKIGTNVLSTAGKFATIGSLAGPIGTAAGAVIGAGVGLIKGIHQRNVAQVGRANDLIASNRSNQMRSAAILGQNPELVNGYVGQDYYAAGGSLVPAYGNMANQPTQGGTATPISSTAATMDGATHEQGGIQLPAMGAEVEDNETTEGNYVFSDRLGFAAVHRRLASAIGKIEAKGPAPERANAIGRLQERIEALAHAQEHTKALLNIN